MSDFRHPKPSAAPPERLLGNVVSFGWVLGTVIDVLDEQRRARREARKLAGLSALDLNGFQQHLAPALARLTAPRAVSLEFLQGWDLHGRLMEWLAREGPEGEAVRHAVDAGDGRRLLDFLREDVLHTRSAEFLRGFQQANHALAREIAGRPRNSP